MSTVVVALADEPEAMAVARAAVPIARLFGASPLAVHARQDGARHAVAAAEAAGIDVRVRRGQPLAVVGRAVEAPGVRALLLGSGAPAGRHPGGSTALELITTSRLPLVVVPPDVTHPERIDRILVPLDGTVSSAAALAETIELARGSEIEVVVLHVLGEEDLPGFSDQPHHEVRAWSEEFVARYCPCPLEELSLEVRVGSPDEQVIAVVADTDADLLALGWSQDLGPGRAAVVRGALTNATVPVLLVPVDRAGRGMRGGR